MSKKIVSHLSGADKPPGARQPMLPAFLGQQIDAVLWLEEISTDPLVRSFAGIVRRRLEAQIPIAGEAGR